MYDKWLYFFNSPLNEINVKDKKEKQIVKKEWLDDSKIKISGKKPKDWSVILEPIQYSNIYKIIHNIKNKKLEAQSLFKKAFLFNNKEFFKNAEEILLSLDNTENEINNIIKNNNMLENKINEKIFNIKRKIFLSKKFDIKLSKELKESLLEKQNIIKNININNNKVTISNKNIVSKGPVPEPPIVNSLDINLKKTKKHNFKNIDESELFTYNSKGGSLKIIKL